MNENSVYGLSTEEVTQRISEGKVNGDFNIKTKSIGKIFFTNTCTLFNAIFLIFTIILIAFLDAGDDGKYTLEDFSDFGFLIVALINWLIGIFQEIKAKRTIDKLSLLSTPKVTVVRDGKETDIAIKDIVMDDCIKLSSGRQICADSVIINGYLEVNESLITGEPDSIYKKEGEELLSGSFVVGGNAYAKVIKIGKDNYANKISSGAKYVKTFPSEIHQTLVKFIRLMGILIIPIGIALFCMKYFVHNNSLDGTVMSVIGNLIGMIPSGLVMLTSAVFCVSVIRLAKGKALAQDLYCVETLARVDMLCLDKTGTLTEGSLRVENVVNYTETEIKPLLKSIIEATCDNNVTAEAIKQYCSVITEKQENPSTTIPFSSKYKYSGAEFNGKTYVLGAPETVLLNNKDKYAEEITSFTEQGFRVLVLAVCEMDGIQIKSDDEIIGLIILSDIIRREAKETLEFFEKQGVAVKVISGDNPITVSKIAERAGVSGSNEYIDASTLDTDEKLEEAADKYVIFGRTTPDQKLKLIQTLKKNHTVAMTGDGVNDVLALKESDCSIAMASGSDAAKNVSRLVLLDNNFVSLPKAVAEGRRTINNLERSAALFLVKTVYNFLFALIFLILPQELPFEPKHMTFLGALTIGLPSYILALEPNNELVTKGFFRKVLTNALPSALTVVACVVTATLVCEKFDDVTPIQVSTICTVIVGFIGFVYIAKISYPFNSLRIAMIVVLVAIFVSAFFIKLPWLDVPAIYGLSNNFNKNMVIVMVPLMLSSVPLFTIMYFFVKIINIKLAHKRIKILDAFDGKGE